MLIFLIILIVNLSAAKEYNVTLLELYSTDFDNTQLIIINNEPSQRHSKEYNIQFTLFEDKKNNAGINKARQKKYKIPQACSNDVKEWNIFECLKAIRSGYTSLSEKEKKEKERKEKEKKEKERKEKERKEKERKEKEKKEKERKEKERKEKERKEKERKEKERKEKERKEKERKEKEKKEKERKEKEKKEKERKEKEKKEKEKKQSQNKNDKNKKKKPRPTHWWDDLWSKVTNIFKG